MSTNPHPIIISTVCSVCGLNWSNHTPDDSGEVSTLECVRLLKAEIARPRPVYRQYWPYDQYTWTCSTGTSTSTNRPQIVSASAVA